MNVATIPTTAALVAREGDRLRRDVDAATLRRLADDVEAGRCSDFVVISLSGDAFEVTSNTSKWTQVALARVLDAWAIGKLMP